MVNSAIVVGGGPGGLYTAWRLLTDPNSTFSSVTILEMSNERVGGRIFTQTFQNSNYVDLGGMRFANTQQVINKVIERIDFDRNAITDFVETDVRMLRLRGETIYSNSATGELSQPVPYNTPYNSVVVDSLFNNVSQKIAGPDDRTRTEWCQWINDAKIPENYKSLVYTPGAPVANIGYWNLLYDSFNEIEAYHYCADAGGYQSNVINWNAADAIPYNGEFGADIRYLRFRGGYTKFIAMLYQRSGIQHLALFQTKYTTQDLATRQSQQGIKMSKSYPESLPEDQLPDPVEMDEVVSVRKLTIPPLRMHRLSKAETQYYRDHPSPQSGPTLRLTALSDSSLHNQS